MLLRILTALVLIPPVLYLVGWSPLWLFLVALVVVTERGLYEYFAISRQAGFEPFSWVGYLASALLCLAQAADSRQPGLWVLSVVAVAVLLSLSLALLRADDLRKSLGAVSSTLLGILYVGFAFSCLVPLGFSAHLQEFSPTTATTSVRYLLLFLFLVIWAGDIFAYFGGRTFGRRPLSPRVSPKKTVEGAVAGFLGSLLAGWAFADWFWRTPEMKTVILLGGLVSLAGQVGDLAESAFKRGAHVKDSGAILPGHGGMLDRIDSLLFGAPALWLALAVKGLLKAAFKA